jgi:hypothetical protein
LFGPKETKGLPQGLQTKMNQLLRPWILELPLQQQCVLMAAIRGCDSVPKEDNSKRILRSYRYTVLHNAKPLTADNIFMVAEVPTPFDVLRFVGSLDHYPMHWLMHFIHAVEIVGYKHPEPDVRGWWGNLYDTLIHNLHVQPETEEQLNTRLRF